MMTVVKKICAILLLTFFSSYINAAAVDYNDYTTDSRIKTYIFNPNDVPWDDIKTQVLLRRVDNIFFEFWNPKTQKWSDNLETIEQGIHKIHAVKMGIKYFDNSQNELYSERIFRPLFPDFVPEDMYKFLKPRTQNPNNTATGGTNNTTNSGSPTGEGNDTGDGDGDN